MNVLDQVNDSFALMNNIDLLFAMLGSVEILHELVDLSFLPAFVMISGSSS